MFLPLLALSTAAAASALVAGGTADTTVFPIDAAQRGVSIAQLIKSLVPPAMPLQASSSQSQVAVQTTLTIDFATLFPMTKGFPTVIAAGLIPNVQTATAVNTLLILGIQPPIVGFGGILNYIVVPVETVVDVIYTTAQIPTTALTTGYTSTFPAGVLPFFLIDPVQRASDIQNIVQMLLTPSIYNQGNPALYQVNIQTTLAGIFSPTITAGLIMNIQSATAIAPGLLQIKYPKVNPPSNISLGLITVGAEQVTGITYVAP